MKNTLYSLMLNDEVVREVDLLANRLGLTRSALVNRILAEYVDYKTPERRIGEIFSAVEQLLRPARELAPFFSPNASSFSLKSSLQYKYRPTVKYEVQLFPDDPAALGQLCVSFRTQSASLVNATTAFFRVWKQIEDRYLGKNVEYALYEGRFVRSLALPERNCTADEIARWLSDYIQLFDRSLKAYVGDEGSVGAIVGAYTGFVRRAQENGAILL